MSPGQRDEPWMAMVHARDLPLSMEKLHRGEYRLPSGKEVRKWVKIRKIGGECQKSTKVNPKREKMGEKVKAQEKAQNSRETRGKQASSGGNEEKSTEIKFQSI